MKYNILLCDDEIEIVELLELYCEKEGFQIYKAYDGIEGINILKNNHIDLAIVDVMMPNLNGFNLVKEARKFSEIPIIILSAKSEDNDKILGLDLGADDYVTKPFNPLEVIARIKANLRKRSTDKVTDIIINRDLELNLKEGIFKVRGEEKCLTAVEFKIIKLFMENGGRIFTKSQIYENVWGEESFGDDNTIMVYISKLREKIEENPKKPVYLKTIRGLGYRLEKSDRI